MRMEKNNLSIQEDFSTWDKVLYAAAMLFFERGYEKTTVKEIARLAEVNRGSVFFAIKNKEHLLYTLVSFVLESLFTSGHPDIGETETDDSVLNYAVEMALQLYMTESREQVRELAITAYALPTTSELIYRRTAVRLAELLGEYNPTWEEKDFFEHAIASGSIMRGYMARPCDLYFTMERKMRVFLETMLTIYNVPKEKIDEAAAFLFNLDMAALAKRTIDELLKVLKTKDYARK